MAVEQTGSSRRTPSWPLALAVLVLGGMSAGLAQSAAGVSMHDLRDSLNFGETGASWVGGIYSLIQGIVGFIGAGWLSDRIGDRKKIMVPALFVFGLLGLLTAAAQNLPELLVVRGLMGLMAGGWVSLMIVYGIECAPRRFKPIAGGLSLAGLTAGLGILAPRLVPHLLNAMDWRQVALVVACPALIVSLLAAFVLSPGIANAQGRPTGSQSSLRLREAFKRRNVVLCMLAAALLFAILAMLTTFGHEYLTGKGLSLDDAGAALSGWGIGGVVGAISIPVLSRYWGWRLCLGSSALLGALFLTLFIYADQFASEFVFAILLGFFVQGAVPVTVLIASESVEDRLRGKAVGLVNLGLNSVGGGVLEILFGSLGAGSLRTTLQFGIACCLACALIGFFGVTRRPGSRSISVAVTSQKGRAQGHAVS